MRKRLLLSLALAGTLVVATALPAQATYLGESCDPHTGGEPSGTAWVCATVNQSGLGLHTGDIASVASWYNHDDSSAGADLIYIDFVLLQKLTPTVTDIQRVDPNQGYTVLYGDSTVSTDWAQDPNPPGGPPDCPTTYEATYTTVVRYKLHYWGTPVGEWTSFFTTVSSIVACSDLN